ncbi:MAG: hypothetical protein NT144_13675 [Bacteroidia bacterium]|nr:hypothetical protein [Bacteroidia bacterium]
MKKISLIVSLIAVTFAVTVNILPSKSECNSFTLNTILQNAIAEGEGGIKLYWSDDIDCPDPYSGDYNYCQYASGNSECDEYGDKTCDCGVNC